MEKTNCKNCDSTIEVALHGRPRIFCDAKCRADFQSKKQKLERRLAIKEVKCKYSDCVVMFTGSRQQRYCSDACRNRAARRKQGLADKELRENNPEEYFKKSRERYLKHRERIKKRAKKRYHENPDVRQRQRVASRKWIDKNVDHVTEYHKKYRHDNPHRFTDRIKNLKDGYIKTQLKQNGFAIITPELIEIKRTILKFKRIKNGSQATT